MKRKKQQIKNYKETPWFLRDDPVHETEGVAVFKDKHPVSNGHLLFIPKSRSMTKLLESYEIAYTWGNSWVLDGTIAAFNIGQNVGEAAGQSVLWPHIHFIPREKGDCSVDEPNGIRLSYPKGRQLNEK
jgi:diadenosine tetraphosphate (Ap4A) HIT family hydrolase